MTSPNSNGIRESKRGLLPYSIAKEIAGGREHIDERHLIGGDSFDDAELFGDGREFVFRVRFIAEMKTPDIGFARQLPHEVF